MKKNLLRLATFVASLVVCLSASAIDNVLKKTELLNEVTSVEALKEATFMLQNEDARVLYTPSGWDIKVGTILDAVSKNDNGGFYKLENVTIDGADHFLMPVFNIDKSQRKFWDGNQYVNSQPEGNVIFGLSGTNAQHGQDGPNLAVWDITYEEGKGFAFHCVGRDIYIGSDDAAARPSTEIKYWRAYTDYIAGYDQTEVETAYALAIEAIKTSDAKAALEAANTAFTTDANLDAYGDAVNAAINVINACEAVNAAYKNLDATGAAIAAEVLAKYNAGDYKDIAELRAAYIEAAKAQTTAGAIMTGAIVNPSFELGTLEGWTSTDGGAIANNYNFGYRTGDKFVERWTDYNNGGKLSDGSLMQTIAGLPNGYYTLTAEMQNLEQGNNSANGKGYYLVANGDSTEVAVAGETVEVTTEVTDGTITIAAAIKGCTGNWVCVDNFQLTYEGTILKDAWYKEGAFAIVGHDFVDGVKNEFVEPRWVADAEGNAYIEVTSNDNPEQEWDSQIFITLNDELKVGDKVNFSMLVRGTAEGVMSTQTHSAPGSYVGNLWPEINVTTEWTKYENVYTVSNATAKTLVFNLAKAATANNFQFDDIAISIEKAPEFEWVDIIKNGDMEGTDTSCFYKTEATVGPSIAAITAGAGKDGSAGIEIQSADAPAEDWDTQFFIRLPYVLPAGTHFLVEFDYKADKEGQADTQSHGEPGGYKHWACAGSPNFTTEWQTYKYEGTVANEADGMYTIAFNLSKNKVATKFVIDNVKFFVEDGVLPTLTASPDLSKKEFSIDVERYPGQGYGATTFTPDFTEALAFLGIEDITAATLVGINADGSEEAAPGPGGIDGWCNSEGTFVGWGTEAKICVKFFPSVPQYEICDMNGGDVVGTTYTVKYALKANDKTAIYAINVKFVEKPVIYLADYTAKAETVELKIAAQDAEGNWAAESATEAINVADITALVGENYVVYGVGAKDGDKETLTNSYSCDPHPGFWCLADGTADVWANSTFGVSFYAAEGVFKTWTKAAVTEDLSTTFYFVNEEAKEYVAYKVVLCAPEVVDEWFAEGNFKVNDYVNGEKMEVADPRYVVDPTDESNSCIVVTSNDEPANDYDAQLFISTTDPLNVGDVITLTMKVRADREQSAASQAHSTPGDYIHWACVGNINFTTEWTEITLTATVTADMSKEDKKMQTITFNLSDMTNKTANNFYFDDIKLEVAVPDAIEGVEAATAANGKYMENGKLVIIKNGKKFNAAGQAIK